MQATFTHIIKYNPRGALTVDEIAYNLIAQHRLLLRVAPLFEQTFPGLTVSKIDIRLRFVDLSSLREEFLLALVLAYQEDMERSVIEFVEAVIGRDIPGPYEWVVTLFVLLIALSGAQYVYRRVFPGKEPAALHNDYRTILNITSEHVNIEPSALHDAVTRTMSTKEHRNLARSVVQFFRPAKRGGASKIETGGTLVISKEAVEEFPRDVDLEETTDAPRATFNGTLLDIRAVDRDKSESGWAARLPEIEEVKKRLPMRLAPTISPTILAKRERWRGDIVLEYSRNEKDEMVPKLIYLMRTVDES